MKKLFIPIFFLSMFVLFSCGPSQKVTSSWVNPQNPASLNYKKLLISALVSNPSYKNTIETDLANAATSKGLQAIRSVDLFPGTFTKDNAPSREAILEKVRSVGCDAILTVALTDRQSETRYVPGTTTYSPYMGYGGYGFGGYYGYMYPSAYSTPGYYTEDKTYFMEARLFDAATENLIWSAQSEAYNPSKIASFSKTYTEIIAAQMQKDLGKKK
jgi:hypothetical protein